MEQVLFRIPLQWLPIKFSWIPDELPVYLYGAMLFLTFVTCVLFTARRSAKLGYRVPRERFWDLAIVLFLLGLSGARITYMIQFDVPWYDFIRIWKGGIVLMGGIIGGAVAFILFYYRFLRRFGVSLWQMADLAAPAVCIGIAIGRVGCLLNGCCWGNVAGASCPAIEFPLLTAPSREMLVDRDGLQTAAGFLPEHTGSWDARTIVGKVEPGSNADKAGIKQGDRIDKFRMADDWQINCDVLIVTGPAKELDRLKDSLKGFGTILDVDAKEPTIKVIVDKPENFRPAYDLSRSIGNKVVRLDLYADTLNNWPRGRNSVQFVVERDGKEVELPSFTPRTLGLHPTQVYETISMILLLFLVLSFYPFRRHDGQVFVLFMVGYAVHRFLNEILRTEPIEGIKGLDMTLSQNFSVLFLAAAIGLEIFLGKTQPKRAPIGQPDEIRA
jgi:phosphatidylglycerol---prolipoprotein diacylglyceryl transferase